MFALSVSEIREYFYILLIFVITLLVTLYHYKRINLYKCSWKLSGPLYLPIIGNAHLFISRTPKDIQALITSLVVNYGKIMRFWLGPELNIVVSEPKYLEKILLSTNILQKGPSYKYIQKYLGPGLLSSGGPIWKHQRKTIFPYFNQKLLENNMESFNIHSKDLVGHLQQYANGQTFNIFHIMADYINKAVCETLLGVKADDDLKNHSEFTHHIEKIYGLIFLRMTKWWYQFDILFKNSKYYVEHKEVTALLKRFFSFVQNRKNNTENYRPVPIDALVDKNTSLQEFSWNALTLQTASEESVATIVSFILMVCGIRKDIQEKLHDELDHVFGDSDRFITKDDFQTLTYLDLVIKETLRMYPIGSLITRSLDKDYTLTDDITLPSGATIAIPIYVIHHHPDLWNDPENFIPERFLPEECANRNPFSYLPFSHGPMNCVGQKFAVWLMKVVTATLLRKFKVDCEYKSLDEVQLMTDISIRPINGYMVSLSPRES